MADQTTTLLMLELFFATCTREFGCLEDHGYSCMSGISTLKSGREILTPFKRNKTDLPATAKVIYECDEVVIEFRIDTACNHLISLYYYAGEKYCLHGLCFSFKPEYDHGYLNLKGYLPVNEEETPEKILCYLSGISYPDMYLMTPGAIAARQKMFPKLAQQREMQARHVQRQEFEKQKQEAVSAAVKAFQAREYKQVITLLRPYERYLSTMERKKLELAIQKIIASIE